MAAEKGLNQKALSIRGGNNCRLLDCWMTVECDLNLSELNAVSPPFHHTIPSANINIAVTVFDNDIASFVPPLISSIRKEGTGTLLRQAPVTPHYGWTTDAELPFSSEANLAALLI